MLTSGSRRLERADKLTRRLADTHKRRVVYLYTAVHDDSKAVLFSVGGGLFVDHAGLQPQYLGAGGHGVFGHRHDLPATPEHVDYVHRRGDMLDRLVRLFAKYRTTEIRVDGEDLESEALQCAGDRVAGAVGPVRKSDNSHGARALQEISYLSTVRVCVQVAPFLRVHHGHPSPAYDNENAPAQEPGQYSELGFRLYESSRTKVTSMFTL